MIIDRTIVLLKRGHFSHTNSRIATQLEQHFPECRLITLDVEREVIRRNPRLIIGGLVHAIQSYGRDALFHRRPLAQCFYRTPWLFHEVRRRVQARLASLVGCTAFTIQTQSLYDASHPSIPHFVYTDHTHLANLRYPAFQRSALYADDWIACEAEIYRNAQTTFVMGSHVQQSLIEDYNVPVERTACVFAGSNVDPSPVALDNADFGNRTILFVGVDWARKGGPTLLKAFDHVAARIPDARLVIVGCQPRVSHRRITVLGCIPKQQVKEQLRKASVFCLPTRIEPFGIAIIEAFHHGLPVVATNVGAIPDVVRDGVTGHLVPPDDPLALGEALCDLLLDPAKCRRYGANGRHRVLERYTWDAVGNAMADRIRSLCGNRLE